MTVVGVGIIDGGGLLAYGEQTDSDAEQSEEEIAIQDAVDCPVLVMVTKHGMGRRIPVRFCLVVFRRDPLLPAECYRACELRGGSTRAARDLTVWFTSMASFPAVYPRPSQRVGRVPML